MFEKDCSASCLAAGANGACMYTLMPQLRHSRSMITGDHPNICIGSACLIYQEQAVPSASLPTVEQTLFDMSDLLIYYCKGTLSVVQLWNALAADTGS